MRKLLISMTLALGLFVPAAALATPVVLEVQQGSSGMFSYSLLHAAGGCELDGFWRCGEIFGAINGTLTADQTGNVFDSIAGTLTFNSANHTVSGALDFGVAAGEIMGSLTIGSMGTFYFYQDRHGTTVANTYDGVDMVYLWGQNFAPSLTPTGDAVDLAFKVSPAIPEPSAAVVFGLGILLVGARGRRTRR